MENLNQFRSLSGSVSGAATTRTRKQKGKISKEQASAKTAPELANTKEVDWVMLDEDEDLQLIKKLVVLAGSPNNDDTRIKNLEKQVCQVQTTLEEKEQLVLVYKNRERELEDKILNQNTRIKNLEKQVCQVQTTLEEKEQLVLVYKDREKELEDKDAELLEALADAESKLSEVNMQYTKLLEFSGDLIELCQRNDQFTEEFDFEAMNEKFKEEEVWGYLGGAKQRAKGEGMEDTAVGQNLGHEGSYSSALSPDPNPAYKKDDFFDTISCNSLAHGPRTGQSRFSDRMKLDTATFGNILQRPHLGYGGYGAAGGTGKNFRDSYNNWERKYNYGGRGRGGNWRI